MKQIDLGGSGTLSPSAVAASVCGASPPGPNMATQAINLRGSGVETSSRSITNPLPRRQAGQIPAPPDPASRASEITFWTRYRVREPRSLFPRSLYASNSCSSFQNEIPQSDRQILRLFPVTVFGQQRKLEAFANRLFVIKSRGSKSCLGRGFPVGVPCFGYCQLRINRINCQATGSGMKSRSGRGAATSSETREDFKTKVRPWRGR